MIILTGTNQITFGEGTLTRQELTIFQKKNNSAVEYHYDSVDTLLFELNMRTHIMESAKALSTSGVYFADLKKSMANPAYWHITDQGRFKLNAGASPQKAIRDIFTNGSAYAFECSMAVIVILYKAILDSIDPRQFDRMNSNLLIFDWQSNSKLHLIDRIGNEEAITGDIIYFENPEVHPMLPWWKGENVVMIEEGLYYGHGHGLGITSAEVVITILNKYRLDGSTQSAFMTDRYVHPDFTFFAPFQGSDRKKHITVKIGDSIYVR
ncbi:protein-glutamine gamma-glutamyltransferase [Paenibacillus alba]|uniref:Protein-glutamine gamma-glutamyltransferase n=1 Tax=Paenibacillus alba TaxID=1197127 RepID=A0ABU6FXL9_9BACL|nr:protein-glutamine gamma-glutamyltransferase [Paenibacillus alba]MEC0226485.1 protein-glutamine gamma-glutamyltransferase [Paenibacillus alba]